MENERTPSSLTVLVSEPKRKMSEEMVGQRKGLYKAWTTEDGGRKISSLAVEKVPSSDKEINLVHQ